jgi:hypothetical protein
MQVAFYRKQCGSRVPVVALRLAFGLDPFSYPEEEEQEMRGTQNVPYS